jgi:hypothetical protein
MDPESRRRSHQMHTGNARNETFGAMTRHAMERIQSRGIAGEAVQAALAYGRVVQVRGAEIHAIGRKEVESYAARGVDLGPFVGVQVVCSGDGAVITVYRNNDFRGLRPQRCRRRSA